MVEVRPAPRPHPGGERNATALARLYTDCALEAARQGDAVAAAGWALKARDVLTYVLEHKHGSPPVLLDD